MCLLLINISNLIKFDVVCLAIKSFTNGGQLYLVSFRTAIQCCVKMSFVFSTEPENTRANLFIINQFGINCHWPCISVLMINLPRNFPLQLDIMGTHMLLISVFSLSNTVEPLAVMCNLKCF